MKYKEDMCCLCLNQTELLTNLYSISEEENSSTYFNKINSTLTKLAEDLSELKVSNLCICQRCVSLIEMVYQFNVKCLDNVCKFKELLEKKREEKKCNVIKNTEEPFDNSNTFTVVVDIKEEVHEYPNEIDSELNEIDDIKEEQLTEIDEVVLQDDKTFQYPYNSIEITDSKSNTQKGKKELHKRKLSKKKQKNEPILEENPDQGESNRKRKRKKVEKIMICEFCGKVFSRPSDLVDHRRTHTNERPFKCRVCGNAFKRTSHLTLHLRIHSGIKAFKCDICNSSFTQKGSLTSHMLKHDENAVRPAFFCDICGQSFTQRIALVKHSSIHTGKRDYTCETCGKTFREKAVLHRHKRTHLENRQMYKCKFCNLSYKTKLCCNNHMLKVHLKGKTYNCKKCRQLFPSKDALIQHMKKYIAERPYACSNCDRAFPTKFYLEKHKCLHTVQKSYSCDLCNKNKASDTDLDSSTHTSEKTEDENCDQEYTSVPEVENYEESHPS